MAWILIADTIFCSWSPHMDASAPVEDLASSLSTFAAFSDSVTAWPSASATVTAPLLTACTEQECSTNVANAQLLHTPGFRRTVTDSTFPNTCSASVTAAGSSAQFSGRPPTQIVVSEPGVIWLSSSTTDSSTEPRRRLIVFTSLTLPLRVALLCFDFAWLSSLSADERLLTGASEERSEDLRLMGFWFRLREKEPRITA